MKTKSDGLDFWRAIPWAIAYCLPFWAALGYGVYRLMKLFGY
jgi:hypothetical protein